MTAISDVDETIDAMGGPKVVAAKLSKIMGRRMPRSTVSTWKANQEFPYPWDRIIRWKASELGVPEPLPECLRSAAVE